VRTHCGWKLAGLKNLVSLKHSDGCTIGAVMGCEHGAVVVRSLFLLTGYFRMGIGPHWDRNVHWLAFFRPLVLGTWLSERA
jgi:hypothetical protein